MPKIQENSRRFIKSFQKNLLRGLLMLCLVLFILVILITKFNCNELWISNHPQNLPTCFEKSGYSKLKTGFNTNMFSPGLFYRHTVWISVSFGNLNTLMIYLILAYLSNLQWILAMTNCLQIKMIVEAGKTKKVSFCVFFVVVFLFLFFLFIFILSHLVLQ